MNATREMISKAELAINDVLADLGMLEDTAALTVAAIAKAALTAALALLLGEPVAWRWKLPSDDFWQFKDGSDKPRLGLPKTTEAKVNFEPLYASPSPSAEIEALRVENAALRKIISDCAASLPNGAFIDTACSVEFMQGLPKEISLVCVTLQQQEEGK